MRRSLLIVAHGSRRGASNDEVRVLTRDLGGRLAGEFREVRCAFLELAEPDIGQGIEDCLAGGAEAVLVLPYFLSAGRHVVSDVPREVETKSREHPEARIELLPYLGAAPGLGEFMAGLVRGA